MSQPKDDLAGAKCVDWEVRDHGTVWFIMLPNLRAECVAGCQAALDDLIAERALLQGVIAADDARLRDAAASVGLDHTGCDAPEWMADKIKGLERDLATLQDQFNRCAEAGVAALRSADGG